MPWVVLGRAAVGSRHHQRHLALVDFWPASKMCTSIHKPLCELRSTGFRQPYNVLQGMSWRAAKAIIKANIIIPVPGMEKVRKVSQKGAVALEQNHKSQAVKEKSTKWLFNTVTKPKFIAERTLQILSRHLGPRAGRFPWLRMLAATTEPSCRARQHDPRSAGDRHFSASSGNKAHKRNTLLSLAVYKGIKSLAIQGLFL